MKKIVYITGASAGIGEACAWKFATESWNLIITGRRKERLEKLKADIQSQYSVDILIQSYDVRDLNAVQENINALDLTWSQVDVLINNAGLAVGKGAFQEGLYDDWERMIDTNLKGLIYVSKELVAKMIANGKGHIINIASLAGIESYGGGNVYCATKHGVRALSRAMRIDLLHQGIKVSTVSPGAADTEFSLVRYKGDKQQADKTYQGFEPLTGNDVAESVYFIASQPQHVNIEEIFLLPTAQATSTIIDRSEAN
ncbi:MAG: SDR family NAD(P)-dependent oxidoreductase [Chitinophagales bacterium]|nr:SDR family NAD(P)-dependent oxidoreductase [Chitinophagales bacterium]